MHPLVAGDVREEGGRQLEAVLIAARGTVLLVKWTALSAGKSSVRQDYKFGTTIRVQSNTISYTLRHSEI